MQRPLDFGVILLRGLFRKKEEERKAREAAKKAQRDAELGLDYAEESKQASAPTTELLEKNMGSTKQADG